MQYQRILAYSRKNFCTSESFKASSCPEGMDLDGSGRDGEYTQPQTTLHTHEGAIVEHLDKEGGGLVGMEEKIRRGGKGGWEGEKGGRGGGGRAVGQTTCAWLASYLSTWYVHSYVLLEIVRGEIHDCVCNLQTIIISRRCVVFKCCYMYL